MHDCEKCGKPAWVTAPIRLAGGVNAWLCTQCSTKWDKFCTLCPAFQGLRRLVYVMASIANARELSVDSADPEMMLAQQQYHEYELELHQVGLEWLGREED